MNVDGSIRFTQAAQDILSGPDFRIRHVEITAILVVAKVSADLLRNGFAVQSQKLAYVHAANIPHGLTPGYEQLYSNSENGVDMYRVRC
jgi:hypothetical protein